MAEKILIESSIGLPCFRTDKHIFNTPSVNAKDMYKMGYFVLESFKNRKIRVTFDFQEGEELNSDLIYFVIPSDKKESEIKSLIISEINSFLSN
jgi:hypothetical protein